MLDFDVIKNCTGCHSCSQICPQKCIRMVKNQNRFLMPVIDEEKCIHCGMCNASCPIINPKSVNKSQINVQAYAAQSMHDKIRQYSSSGGIFSEIAMHIISQNGIVFGAAFDENKQVRHMEIKSISDLKYLRGSKYVQSEIGTSYIKVKEYLDAGRPVLFGGTPCQIGGLYGFLKKEYDNLYTQDFICHGVPSPMVWEKYMEFCEADNGAVKSVSFRHKKYGWKKYSLQLIFLDGTETLQIHNNDLYMRSFLRNLSLRQSCYNCQFKNKNRLSDFTLADFWGISNICPEMDDDKGTSLLLLNSYKARKLFEQIKKNVRYKEVDFEESIKYNSAMTKSAIYNKKREKFLKCVREKGFKTASRRFLKIPIKSKIKMCVKRVINGGK